MKAAELREFLVEYRKTQTKGQEWLDTVPRDINSAFYDNPFVESFYANNELLMRAAFGELYEDIYWFLEEWHPSIGKITMPDETSYDIQNVDDYILYLITEGMILV